jgi:hypothetical protein
MEFHIMLPAPSPDIEAIEQAIQVVDPSALIDIDPASHAVRVAASIDATQLVALMGQAGYPLSPQQVTQVPSICCGGCGG